MTLYSLLVVSSNLEDFWLKVSAGVVVAALLAGFALMRKGLKADLDKGRKEDMDTIRTVIEEKMSEQEKHRRERDEQFFRLHREHDANFQQLYREQESRFARIETTQEHDKRDIREIAGSLKTLEKKLDDTKDEVIRAIMDVRAGK